MLDEAVRFLACPHCGGALEYAGRTLHCPAGHMFDIARQGYVSLLASGGRGLGGDSAAMVRAREQFLEAGHYAPIGDALVEAAARHATDEPGCVVDVGAGTGYYLSAVLRALSDRIGLALDASKHALRRAARAHDKVAAVGCDIWSGLPVADRAAILALNVFAPRNPAELRRVLQPSGRLLVVTPTAEHLAELVSALGLLNVDEDKSRRLATQLDPYFDLVEERTITASMSLNHDDADRLAGMGPSAWHVDDLADRVRRLPDPTPVTLSITLGAYRPLA